MVKVQDVIIKLEEFAPLNLRVEHDPTGFQIGNRSKNVNNIMTTLDIRPTVVEEAISKNIDLIISHHPIMFNPAKNLDIDDPQNKMYYDLIQHDIAVYTSHTNLDKARGGMNDWLSNKIGLKNISSIEELDGLGRIGYVNSTDLNTFSKLIKNTFNLSGLRIVEPYNKLSVHKVAVIGGDGGKYYKVIKELNVDTFITGDVYYHTAHEMQALGINVIDPGHHIEEVFIPKMAEKLNIWNEQNEWKIAIIQSETNTEPYRFI